MALGRIVKGMGGHHEQPRRQAVPDDDDEEGLFGDLNEYDALGAGAGLALRATPAGFVQVAADTLSANKKLETALAKAIHKHPEAAEVLGGTPEEVLATLNPEEYPNINNELTKTSGTTGFVSAASVLGGGVGGLVMGAVTNSWILGGAATLGTGFVVSEAGRSMLGIGEDHSKDVITRVFELAKKRPRDINAALARLDASIGASGGGDGTTIAMADHDADDPFDSGLPGVSGGAMGRV